jgi:hypothetical protein
VDELVTVPVAAATAAVVAGGVEEEEAQGWTEHEAVASPALEAVAPEPKEYAEESEPEEAPEPKEYAEEPEEAPEPQDAPEPEKAPAAYAEHEVAIEDLAPEAEPPTPTETEIEEPLVEHDEIPMQLPPLAVVAFTIGAHPDDGTPEASEFPGWWWLGQPATANGASDGPHAAAEAATEPVRAPEPPAEVPHPAAAEAEDDDVGWSSPPVPVKNGKRAASARTAGPRDAGSTAPDDGEAPASSETEVPVRYEIF